MERTENYYHRNIKKGLLALFLSHHENLEKQENHAYFTFSTTALNASG
jgi:hypothetical protein